ncbi:unnamed protein product [Dovyalis caffra]|uniref:Uncharacterized protein n=1 Tax=Dovyalis caffra TaxID=77055 RepID=A0AAV1RYL9_9ROSI|nr:unnamed protein product [Dovyalis caffra]
MSDGVVFSRLLCELMGFEVDWVKSGYCGAARVCLDQPRNTVLITKILKIGVVVKEWVLGDEIVTSKIVESAVNRLVASTEGDGMRKRAAEMAESVRGSAAEGGVSRMEMESFIAHITR